jgi:hypothetical protein
MQRFKSSAQAQRFLLAQSEGSDDLSQQRNDVTICRPCAGINRYLPGDGWLHGAELNSRLRIIKLAFIGLCAPLPEGEAYVCERLRLMM